MPTRSWDELKRGFTFLETLVVISIILFMLGLLAGVYLNGIRRARISAAVALIGKLTIGLERYEGNLRAYPPGTDVDEGTLYRYLGASITDQRTGKSFRSVTDFSSDELVEYSDPLWNKSLRVVDPWGNAVFYTADRAVQKHNKSGVEISSAGPNGIFNDDDDIDNWSK